jgi:hypothetical protein
VQILIWLLSQNQNAPVVHPRHKGRISGMQTLFAPSLRMLSIEGPRLTRGPGGSGGGQVVNMETSALYAASETCGIRCLWTGHVSDCLAGSEWEEWATRSRMDRVSRMEDPCPGHPMDSSSPNGYTNCRTEKKWKALPPITKRCQMAWL